MQHYSPPVERLIEEFEKLPGIGRKGAARLAFHILALPRERALDFADAIVRAKETVFRCKVCCDLTDKECCRFCSDENRDKRVICVVSDPKDVQAIERSKGYNGTYHVLHGVLSPMANIGPDELTIKELARRAADPEVREIILATDPDTEGEATAAYLTRLLRPLGVKMSRLAYGIPVGGHLEYADEITLSRAIEGRKEL